MSYIGVKLLALILFTLACLSFFVSADQSVQQGYLKITTLGSVDDALYGDDHFVVLLREALEITREEFGPFRINIETSMFSQKDEFQLLQRGDIDVIWSMTSMQREREHIALRFPLATGLYGYRLLVANGSVRSPSSRPLSITQLKQQTLIQGENWPDVDILRANGFTVDVRETIPLAYRALASGNADYFPRGAAEINLQFEKHFIEDLHQLNIEPTTALYYPTAMYFFVSRENPQLAIRLNVGLAKLSINGRFAELIEQHASLQKAKQMVANRTVYTLLNPTVSPATSRVLDRIISN